MLAWTCLAIIKRTDGQQKVLQVSSGLAFDAVLDIRAIDLPVGVKDCRRGDTRGNTQDSSLRDAAERAALHRRLMDAHSASVF